MTWTTFAAVGAGAAVGAPLRYVVDLGVTKWAGDGFPWGTLTVNLIGSGLFGLLTGLAAVDRISAGSVQLLGVGFCGAFTTVSAFAWEVVALAEESAPRRALAYIGLSVAFGLLLAGVGFAAGRSL